MAAIRKDDHLLSDAVIGAVSGVVATLAMTVVADGLFRHLPPHEQYPLPPREITQRIVAGAGLQGASDDRMVAGTLASHYAFGAATGALFHVLTDTRRRGPAMNIAFALIVWLVSYLGWIPGTRILRSATTHPTRRNRLMIAAHAGFGIALYAASALQSRALRPLRGGPALDAETSNARKSDAASW